MRGNRIVVNADAKGAYEWGYLATAEKPGTVLQIDPTVALKHGKHTWKVYQPGADGEQPLGPFVVLIENLLQGQEATVAYTAGDFVKMYIPLPGDELNLLLKDLAGTSTGAASDHAAGEKLMVDHGTGKMIATTGSPETESAVLLETVNDVLADVLAWCRWSGV